MFSTLPKTNFNFSVAFNLSSANAFNLDQSKILLCGKELNDVKQHSQNIAFVVHFHPIDGCRVSSPNPKKNPRVPLTNEKMGL